VLALGGAELSSPKQTTAERRASLFPYYAGFSEVFVQDVLIALQANTDHIILDPWNGSGTTTTVAKRAGLESIGIDLNPALAVVAKARLASDKNVTVARNLVRGGSRKVSAAFLREVCHPAYNSGTRSILLLAIFRLVRRKLRDKDCVATNPTWWQSSRSEVKQVISAIAKSHLDAELAELGSKLRTADCATRTSLVRADILSASLPKVRADIIISSPPYLTRIDYVKATLPELLVLSLLDEFSIDQMRRSMIGSPVVGCGPNYMPRGIGAYAKSVLFQIASHGSKASKTYYLAFFSTYISKMFASFEALAKFARPGAKMVLVVQGSHYKEIFVDLAQLSIELATSAGFNFVSRADFRFKQSFAQLNPRASGYNMDTARETVLLFERPL